MLPSDTSFQSNTITTLPRFAASTEHKNRNASNLVPLLPQLGVPARDAKGSPVWLTVISLVNSFVGAGLMALPHAFAGMGLYVGLFIIASVTIVMHQGMIIITKCADESEHSSLSKIVRDRLGCFMGGIVQACILFNNFGVLVLYLVVIGDTLVGSPKDGYDGLLPNLAGDHSGQAWYLSRWFVILLLCVCCIQPLILKRRLGGLAGTSIVAIGLVSLLCFFSIFLVILAVVNNDLKEPSMVPNLDVKEEDIESNCSINLIIQGISIYIFAYIAHYNIPPLMEEMENSSEVRMTVALRQAVGFSVTVYTIVPVCCWIVFGPLTDDDILKNLGAHSLSRFMPGLASQLASYTVSIGYTAILLCIFPMDNWALRQNVSALLYSTTRPSGWKFYCVTYLLLFGVYVSAMSIGSVFIIVSVVGCTACSIIGLILPGLLIRQDNPKRSFVAWTMILCGIVLIFHGTFGHAWRFIKERPVYCI